MVDSQSEPADEAARQARRERSILPLRLRDLTYRVGQTQIIHDISLTIAPSGRSIVLGPNGAGKSLLLRLIHGLIVPSGGRIDWNGQSPAIAARRQAMVFQEPVVLRRSVRANIAYALALQGVHRSARRQCIAEALALAGLEALAERPARVLSGGEKQRLALARAWVQRPEVMLMDEPTSSLDPAATRAFELMLEDIDNTGTKVVLTTHDLGQARRLADEVIFLHRGRLVEQTAADAFFTNPRTPEARAFVEGHLLW